jgi:hypothetical protein
VFQRAVVSYRQLTMKVKYINTLWIILAAVKPTASSDAGHTTANICHKRARAVTERGT